MNQIAIVTLEDEPEVRQAITRDLESFGGHFRIESAEDVEDAKELLASIERDGDLVGLLLCDHRLPGKSGVDFLTELEATESGRTMRKVLLTGQANQQDTIQAINSGGLRHFISKPWTSEQLAEVVREQLTDFVLENRDVDPLRYLPVLDGARLMEKVARGSMVD